MAHKGKDTPKQRIPKDMQDSMTRGGKHKSRQQKVNRADSWSKNAKHKITDTDKAPVEESKSKSRSDPLHSEIDRPQAMRDLIGPAQKSKAWSELRSRAERSRAGKFAPGKQKPRRKEDKHKIDYKSDDELDENLVDVSKDEISVNDDNQLIESEMIDTPSLNRMAQLAGIKKQDMSDLEENEYSEDTFKKLKTKLREAEKLREVGPGKTDYFDFENEHGAWIHGFNKCLSLFRDLK